MLLVKTIFDIAPMVAVPKPNHAHMATAPEMVIKVFLGSECPRYQKIIEERDVLAQAYQERSFMDSNTQL